MIIRRNDWRRSLFSGDKISDAHKGNPPKLPVLSASLRYVRAVDAITRDIILKLTTRVADLEAAAEVDRTMLKQLTQEYALATGKSFDATIFDLQRAEAFSQQREKMAVGVETQAAVPEAPFVLDLPEIEPI